MTPTERAIAWCNRTHALQDLTMAELHERGQCCAECGIVRKEIEAAIADEREACAKLARDHADADDTVCVDRYNEAAHNIADAIEDRK